MEAHVMFRAKENKEGVLSFVTLVNLLVTSLATYLTRVIFLYRESSSVKRGICLRLFQKKAKSDFFKEEHRIPKCAKRSGN